MSDPSNIYAIDDIKFLTGYNIEVVVASEQAIKEALERYYADKAPSYDEVMEGFDESEIQVDRDIEDDNVVDMEKSAADAPVVKLVNLILLDAIKKGASDIHVEPYEKDFRVRYRVDGVLYEAMKPPMKLKAAIISRLKIMAELDIAERRLPQDGRIKLKLGKGREMDFRVSVCPTLFGEKVVLRLLDKSSLQLDMTKLGFDPEPLKAFKENIDRPYGMVLVTGPTGSGKTTTLYSALSELNKTTDNISTAEDPVEFNFSGINQVQMHEDIGLNFAAALRSFLRQDPDIIMVGEIRDFETAEIGIKAALTGHLVLSTLHTNDAPGTVSRLLNMGIEPFLVTSAVNLILAQRLARKLCQECKKPVDVAAQALTDIGVQPDEIGSFQVFEPAGSPNCNDRGYKGRVALYEVMPMVVSLKELGINGASTAELKNEAIQLRSDGRLVPLKTPPMTPVETKQLCYSILADAQKHKFEEENELDLSFGVKGLSRFRANIFMQRGAVGAAFRTIPFKILTFQELGLPPIISDLAKKPRGLVLVTGPTGSGKSTTLASIIDKINTERHEHIVTIEDPIEYLHPHKNCVVNQREVGADTHSFKKALKYILRQDPDVVLVGEMRDLETIEAALVISETGHLAFGTLHTNSCVQTINRILDVFPPYQQPQIRAQLSFVLEGVVTQNLISKASGPGRVLAIEVMVPNAAIRNLIREDKVHQIYSAMQVGQSKFGMQTFNQSLGSLIQRGLITLEEGLGRSSDPDELRNVLTSAARPGVNRPVQAQRP